MFTGRSPIRLAEEADYLRDRQRLERGDFITHSPSLQRAIEIAASHEDTAPILVSGEAGTGKELVAEAIHRLSSRRDAPFLVYECGGSPAGLVALELFGRGHTRGLCELARGGTLLLDEVSALPRAVQDQLLELLDRRRGDVVIIATTSRDLRALSANGFNHDLYQLLALSQIVLPPLRERKDDIRLLAGLFFERLRRRLQARLTAISRRAMAALESYAWPGNGRELRGVIERMVVVHRHEPLLELEHLPHEIRVAHSEALSGGGGGAEVMLPAGGVALDGVERSLVLQALQRTHHNQSAAAKLLGISRYALRHRVRKLGLSS